LRIGRGKFDVGEAIVCLNIADDAGKFLLGDGEGVAVEHNRAGSLMIRLTNIRPENGRRRAR